MNYRPLFAAALAVVCATAVALFLASSPKSKRRESSPAKPAPSSARSGISTPVQSGAVDPGQFAQGTDRESAKSILARLHAAMNSGDENARRSAVLSLLPDLAAADPNAAARLVEEIPARDPLRLQAILMLGRSWTETDSHAALAWAEQLPGANEKRYTVTAIVLKMAESNPAQALQVAQELGSDRGTIENTVLQWAQRDPSAAIDWARKQPQGADRDAAVKSAAFVLSKSQPMEAAQLVVNEMPPGPEQEEATMSVVHQWALKDMSSAERWVEQFPASPLRDRAEKELAGIRAYSAAS